ncbi:MAG: hypothetical protein HW408_767 [Actinobacteria bacterium]|nr:hypothetical protein [Actinomycetota bacterium]
MTQKPSEGEEGYFVRMEFERRRQAEIEKHKRDTQKEKERLKSLHFMKCPKCGMELIEIDYRGVQVDKCSGCEGVWLDAGELEAVAGLEKSVLDGLFSVFKR